MGWELIFVAIIATMVTRAWEKSQARSKARWEAARQEADDRRQARANEREQRTQARRKRFAAARKTGPSDPLWWAWASAKLTAGLIAAGIAAARGAKEGAAIGAREGYKLGKERAAARAARKLRERAAWRNGRRAGMADGRQAADDDHAAEQAARDAAREPPVDTEPCGTCGAYVPPGESHVCGAGPGDGPEATTPGAEITVYIPLTAAGEIHGAGVHRPWIAESPDDALRPDRPSGTPAFREAAAAAAWARYTYGDAGSAGVVGVDTPVIHRPGESRPVISGAALGAADGIAAAQVRIPAQQRFAASDPEEAEIVDAEIVDDPPSHPIGRSLPMSGETTSPAANTDAININGMTVSGGDGEAYTSAINAMTTLATLLGRVQTVVGDLGDVLSGREIDAATRQGLNELDDLVDAAAAKAAAVKKHAQGMHEPIAAAIAGAGGSQNVAQRGFYDDV